jgi:PAS domain-containing protein
VRGYTAEYRLRRKDGAYIYVEDHGVFLCGDGLGATRMLGSFGDITKRKKAEEAMRESEERYHSLFDNSHAVMLLINPDTGSIVDANHAACIYYGYTKQELTVKNISEINTLDPEDILKEMQRAKET